MHKVNGLHHVTAICGPAQENLDFYAGVLGMRLVKKSVNQDDPTTYHLFYADAEGNPGTDLTFFPWARLAPPRDGYGLSTEVSLTVPESSFEFWNDRLTRYEVENLPMEKRFGRQVLPFIDPHGMRLALVGNSPGPTRSYTAWEQGPIPVEHQIRGLESARMVERDLGITADFLSNTLGFKAVANEHNWHRFSLAGDEPGQYLDLLETPHAVRGAWGAGSIHHLAWRVDDNDHQLEVRKLIAEAGAQPTPVIDRFWFKSVYFREPGGVLFELATDGPGFAVDEASHSLGKALVLPPWLENDRAEIEAALPGLVLPNE